MNYSPQYPAYQPQQFYPAYNPPMMDNLAQMPSSTLRSPNSRHPRPQPHSRAA